MPRELREVFFVDGVRTAFGRAGPNGVFWRTRADDMAVKVTRELLRRNPHVPPERIGDVILAATAENLHDRFPQLTKEASDTFAVRSHQRLAAAWQNGAMAATVVPMSVFSDDGWQVA